MNTRLLLILMLLIVGCDGSFAWWESRQVGGRLFVVNKRTGLVLALADGEMRPVPTARAPWEDPSKPTNHEDIARRKTLSDGSWIVHDMVQVSVETRYRRGQVEIRGAAEPAIEELQSPTRGVHVFTLEIQDWQGFRVVEVDVQPEDLTLTLDESGKPSRLSFVKRVDVAAEDWAEAGVLDVRWSRSMDEIVQRWAKTNPKDALARQELAAAEQREEKARFEAFVERVTRDKAPPVGEGPPKDEREVEQAEEVRGALHD
jgi:hypothetical protein